MSDSTTSDENEYIRRRDARPDFDADNIHKTRILSVLPFKLAGLARA